MKAHLGRMMSKWHLRDRVQILWSPPRTPGSSASADQTARRTIPATTTSEAAIRQPGRDSRSANTPNRLTSTTLTSRSGATSATGSDLGSLGQHEDVRQRRQDAEDEDPPPLRAPERPDGIPSTAHRERVERQPAAGLVSDHERDGRKAPGPHRVRVPDRVDGGSRPPGEQAEQDAGIDAPRASAGPPIDQADRHDADDHGRHPDQRHDGGPLPRAAAPRRSPRGTARCPRAVAYTVERLPSR